MPNIMVPLTPEEQEYYDSLPEFKKEGWLAQRGVNQASELHQQSMEEEAEAGEGSVEEDMEAFAEIQQDVGAEGNEADAATEGSEAANHELRFQQQCFMLWNIDQFVSKSKNSWNKKGFPGITCLASNDPTAFMSRVSSIEGVEPLFEASAAEYSALVPRIRMFKVSPNAQLELPGFASIFDKIGTELAMKAGVSF